MAERSRVSLMLGLVVCLLALSVPSASASHVYGHECTVEIGTICQPETIYDGINRRVCQTTGECTPLFEVVVGVLCSQWPPYECPIG
jgi:hypothetical protein